MIRLITMALVTVLNLLNISCVVQNDSNINPQLHYVYPSGQILRHRIISTGDKLYALVYTWNEPQPQFVDLSKLTKITPYSNMTYRSINFLTYYRGSDDKRNIPWNLTSPAFIMGNNKTNLTSDIFYSTNGGYNWTSSPICLDVYSNGDNNVINKTIDNNNTKVVSNNIPNYNRPCQIANFSSRTNVIWSESIGKWVTVNSNQYLIGASNLFNWTNLIADPIQKQYTEIHEFFSIATQDGSTRKWVFIYRYGSYGTQIYYDFGDINFASSKMFLTYENYPSTSNPLDISTAIDFAAVADISEYAKYMVATSSLRNAFLSSISWNRILWIPKILTLKIYSGNMYLNQAPVLSNLKKPIATRCIENLTLFPGDNILNCYHSTSYIISASFFPDIKTPIYGFILHKSSTRGIIIQYNKDRRAINIIKRNYGIPFDMKNFDTIIVDPDLDVNFYNEMANEIRNFLIIVDVSLVEAFFEDGRYFGSVIAFPEYSNDIAIFTKWYSVVISSLNLTLYN